MQLLPMVLTRFWTTTTQPTSDSSDYGKNTPRLLHSTQLHQFHNWIDYVLCTCGFDCFCNPIYSLMCDFLYDLAPCITESSIIV